jgi:hypothetical protein
VHWFGKRKAVDVPLTGGRPRLKTYSAESGYVYQYTFAGQRAKESGTEYVFEVSRDRNSRFRASILVADAVTRSWQETHGRELISGERYAIAKLALQRFLDRGETVNESVEITPGADEAEQILADLGCD